MQDFLTQINYNAWILPALLLLPLAGALFLLATGALASDDGTLEAVSVRARGSRCWSS